MLPNNDLLHCLRPSISLPTPGYRPKLPKKTLTRRRRYLETHPSYFASASAEAELSEPLAYDRWVRRHLNASEREAEGKKRGFAGTLEAGLLRGEARREGVNDSRGYKELANRRETKVEGGAETVDWSVAESPPGEVVELGQPETEGDAGLEEEEDLPEDDVMSDIAHLRERIAESQSVRLRQRPRQPILLPAQAISDGAKTYAKRQGEERWRALLAERFVSGLDENFDYTIVDEDEELEGDWAGRQAEEGWFEEQESEIEGNVEGESGIQDF
ncbi:MAG: hypothetical protein LQ340_000864 [Diploschistes diacapsis]|nr:MAG: hypothetical protein LQ340_000864 [Diploschistes diacapsis]